jgi:hypothetical protein
MAESNKQRRHQEDRYAERVRFYDGLTALPNKVSRPNSAVILIAVAQVPVLPALAVARAPWFAYLALFATSVLYCSLAVWREKHAKPKQKEFSGTSPPELGISAADL